MTYMVIRSRFVDRQGNQVGDPCVTAHYPDRGGWESPTAFVKDRLAHFRHHPYEEAEAYGNGVCITERTGRFGLRKQHIVTFEE